MILMNTYLSPLTYNGDRFFFLAGLIQQERNQAKLLNVINPTIETTQTQSYST